MDPKEIVEVGIGSLGKIKLIRALAEETKMVTIYVLHKKTHLKREDIRNNLDDLVRIGWVRQTKSASVVYSINRDDPGVMHFVSFLRDVSYMED
jgi:hypothetical protein